MPLKNGGFLGKLKIRLGSEGLGGVAARFCSSEVCQFSPFLGIELNAIGYWSMLFFYAACGRD